jgi:hypothetical protein
MRQMQFYKRREVAETLVVQFFEIRTITDTQISKREGKQPAIGKRLYIHFSNTQKF